MPNITDSLFDKLRDEGDPEARKKIESQFPDAEKIEMPKPHPNRGAKRNTRKKKGRKMQDHHEIREPWKFEYEKVYDGVSKISPLFDFSMNM